MVVVAGVARRAFIDLANLESPTATEDIQTISTPPCVGSSALLPSNGLGAITDSSSNSHTHIHCETMETTFTS